MCCGGVSELVEVRATVCGDDGKVVKVAIKLGHVIFRGRSLTSGGMGGQHRGDLMGSHCKVGGVKRVTMLGVSPEFPIHCPMEGDNLQVPSHPSLGRGYETVPIMLWTRSEERP